MSENTKSPDHRRIGVALVLGIAYPLVLRPLYAYSGHLLQVAFEFVNAFGFGETTIRLFVHTAYAVSLGAIVGLLFGVPLGLLVRPSIFGYWLLFLVAQIAAQVVLAVVAGVDVGWVIANWTVWHPWVDNLAILGIATLMRRRRDSSPHIEQSAG